MSKEATCISVPSRDIVTRDSLIEVLDAQLTETGFNELAPAAIVANIDPTVTEPTTDAPVNGLG